MRAAMSVLEWLRSGRDAGIDEATLRDAKKLCGHLLFDELDEARKTIAVLREELAALRAVPKEKPEARGRPQWRPASEPPDTSRDVLVVTPDDMGKPCQWVAHYDGGWCCVGEYDPTHWMELPPLPEPPTPTAKEQSDE